MQTDSFCQFWSDLDYVFTVSSLFLMAFGSVERYLLIFHHHLILRHRWLQHYLPIVLCIAYPFLLYTGLIYVYPCVNEFDYKLLTCGGPCYFHEAALSTFDEFANVVFPVVTGTIANALLIVRVISGKRRMKQQHIWRKNLRLMVQLLSVVILHNVVWIPLVCSTLLMLYSPVGQGLLVALSVNILPYGIYVVVLLSPFMTLLGLVELWPSWLTRNQPRFGTTNTVNPARS